ncbi:response regulator [Beijerinckia mobilis]|uniref:response regulator n=1 Tax=Beijerinckia mobilis TaxID=231434 RepID=UPI00055509CD|nr:response regulator transcription factor [Beijerinckia mobilis]
MNADEKRLLLVEDDPEIRRLLADFFHRENFAFDAVSNGNEMDEALRRAMPDLILLDLMLPGEDGLALCRRLRALGNTPVIIITAKSDSVDRIVGLELGADDYVCKPFDPRELLARIRAVLRRVGTPLSPPSRRFVFGEYQIDIDARSLTGPEGAVALTSAEFELLACFVQRPRRVLTREQLLDLVHGRSRDPFDRAIDMLVSRLRKKLDSVELIATVRNGGYLFTAVVTSAP